MKLKDLAKELFDKGHSDGQSFQASADASVSWYSTLKDGLEEANRQADVGSSVASCLIELEGPISLLKQSKVRGLLTLCITRFYAI